jgi:hypothetical protein
MSSGSYITTISLGVIPLTIAFKILFRERNGLFHNLGIILIMISIILVNVFENKNYFTEEFIEEEFSVIISSSDKIITLISGKYHLKLKYLFI